MNPPIDISSIGHLAQLLQQPVARIRVVAAQLAICESRVNDVAYFSAADVELIRTALVSELQQRESASINQRSNIS